MSTKKLTKKQQHVIDTMIVEEPNLLNEDGPQTQIDAEPVVELNDVFKTWAQTKVVKAVKTKKTGVGQQILQLIADGVLSNKEIVEKVLKDNPERKTTYACVAWYQSQVRAGKIDLPKPQEEVMSTL